MRLPRLTSPWWMGTLCLVWTTLLGLVMVVSILPFNGLALVLWVVTVVSPLRRRSSSTELALHISAMVAFVAGAVCSPVKIEERVLDRQVVLPKSAMSLAELRDWTENAESRPGLPVRTWLDVENSEAARVVHWPRTALSLREFVSAIEGQTSLRHQFHGCGNGWTILWGNDCSFGLALRNPRLPFW